MKRFAIDCGFMPLVDAAPLIVAKELGFARHLGLDLRLHKMPNWSSVRDKLAIGEFHAAQLLSPIAIAAALNLGGMAQKFDILSVLSINGNVIGASPALASRLDKSNFQDAAQTGRELAKVVGKKLRIGVPFPFSMHLELVNYWLSRVPEMEGVEISTHTVPPQLMPDAIEADEIDLFCVGEPWGSFAVESCNASLILPCNAIWKMAPEKVLAVKSGWADTHREEAAALLEAVHLSARYISDIANVDTVCEILAREAYVNVNSELIERALSGQILINSANDLVNVPRFVEFHKGAASFPWRSGAKWIAQQIAERNGLDVVDSMEKAGAVFRTDLYRDLLKTSGIDFPGASEKIEGSLEVPTAVSSERGEMILEADVFFDRNIFDSYCFKSDT